MKSVNKNKSLEKEDMRLRGYGEVSGMKRGEKEDRMG